jgi:hypothetical protein
MDARTIKRNARNYVDWKQTRANLLLALMEAEDNKAKLAQDGYLETPHGFVNVEYPSDVYAAEYIGSALNCPSGKYYTPFANSNVEDCPRCHGSGHTTKSHDCEFCKGKGSRSLSELAKMRNETISQTVLMLAKNYDVQADIDNDSFPCNACHGSGRIANTCDWCEGLGSREAFEDQIWHDELERQADKHGLYWQSGEGDPLDQFLCLAAGWSLDSD